MILQDLLSDFALRPVPVVTIRGMACHSKQVREGDLFVAVRGTHSDGHSFVGEAIQRGAAAVVVDHVLAEPVACPTVVVPDTKRVLPIIAARFYGQPATRLHLVGVTGTCGKTTTVYLLKSIFEGASQRVGLLGTVAYEIGFRHLPSTNTTPGSLELQQFLAQMVEQSFTWCMMEVSSHALDQGRVDGLQYDAAVFTNLGSDHLDYHRTLEHYAASKRRLFSYLKPGGFALINTDDAYGRTLAETLHEHAVVTYGINRPAMVTARDIASTWQGTNVILESPWGVIPLTAPLIGRHNAMNMTAAAATAAALGVPLLKIRDAMAETPQVPGRLETVPNDLDVHIVIDFAHTADALRQVLLSLRELVRGRLIVVFGCGGDRDQTKRPIMGQVASLFADYVIVTSDNPRSEDPYFIMHQIKQGFVPGFRHFQAVIDRERAIATALAMANADDAVLIAGKGHESYQFFQHVAVPFSDRDTVERLLTHTAKVVAV